MKRLSSLLRNIILVTGEQMSYADRISFGIFCIRFNIVRETSYVPECFCVGVQIILYMGKAVIEVQL